MESGNGGNEKREWEINQWGIGTGGDEKKKRKMENRILQSKLPCIFLIFLLHL